MFDYDVYDLSGATCMIRVYPEALENSGLADEDGGIWISATIKSHGVSIEHEPYSLRLYVELPEDHPLSWEEINELSSDGVSLYDVSEIDTSYVSKRSQQEINIQRTRKKPIELVK